ncbi:hypothetical protein [Sphingopyxis fribergensis]
MADLLRARRWGGALVLSMVAGLGWWWAQPMGACEDGAPPLVQLPPADPSSSAVPVPAPRVSTAANTGQSPSDPRIAATFQDPGAVFRNVRSADDQDQVICGEVRLSSTPYFRRFVWVSEVQMLATDDGGTQFAGVAKLCDGTAKLRP